MWNEAVLMALSALLGGGVVKVIDALSTAFWKRHQASKEMREEDQEEGRTAVQDYQAIVAELNRQLRRAKDRSDEQWKAVESLAREHLACREENATLYEFARSIHHVACLIRDQLFEITGKRIDIPDPPPGPKRSSEGDFWERQARHTETLRREVESKGSGGGTST